MKKNTDKKVYVIYAVVVWILFSVGYIMVDIWQDFKVSKIQSAYQQGRSDAIQTIMSQASKCNAVPLYSGDESINVVSVECLQQGPQAQPESAPNE